MLRNRVLLQNLGYREIKDSNYEKKNKKKLQQQQQQQQPVQGNTCSWWLFIYLHSLIKMQTLCSNTTKTSNNHNNIVNSNSNWHNF